RLAMGETAAQAAQRSAIRRCHMTLLQKGLLVAGLHCVMVLSLTGKLLYDRATYPRVWVRTARWDPNLPIRGRYLALQLVPEQGSEHFIRTNQATVLFFVPEHSLPFEQGRFRTNAPELWA